MKKLNIKILMIALVLILFVFACNPQGNTTADYSTYEGLKELVESGRSDYYLIDLRTASEIENGVIPTAKNIDYNSVESNPGFVSALETRIPEIRKDSLIIVYCASGGRSGAAYTNLQISGYSNVYDFGAVSNWPQADLVPYSE